MTLEEVLERARSQQGLGIKYKMGGGIVKANWHTCADSKGGCDCSAFVCWALGINKNDSYPYLVPAGGSPDPTGEWYFTDNIWNDAVMIQAGLFQQVPQPTPGAVVVYPGHYDGRQRRAGHVGLISAVGGRGKVRVIHCSSGNFKKFKDAVQETDDAVFKANSRSIYSWCANVELPLVGGAVQPKAALLKPVCVVVVADPPADDAIANAARDAAALNPVGRKVIVKGDPGYPAQHQIDVWTAGHSSPGAVVLRGSGALFRVLSVSEAKKRSVLDAAYALAAERQVQP